MVAIWPLEIIFTFKSVIVNPKKTERSAFDWASIYRLLWETNFTFYAQYIEESLSFKSRGNNVNRCSSHYCIHLEQNNNEMEKF